jgi:hypothetical protein
MKIFEEKLINFQLKTLFFASFSNSFCEFQNRNIKIIGNSNKNIKNIKTTGKEN